MPIKHHACPMLLLLAISLGIGFYKIAVFQCISRDSTLFLAYADDLAEAPGPAIRAYDQHPGYPALLLAARQTLKAVSAAATLEDRLLASQIATLLCRSLAICVLYLFFLGFTSRRFAWLNALILLLIPAYANNGSDVLSDWPSLLFMALSGLFCLHGIRKDRSVYFIGAAVMAGLGYYIRPEAAFFLPVLFLYYAIQCLVFSCRGKRILVHLVVMAAIAGSLILPYMFFKGAVFPKKNLGEFSHSAPVGAIQREAVRCGADGSSQSLTATAEGLFHLLEEAANSLLVFIAPWALILAYKSVRFRKGNEADRFLVLFSLSWCFLLVWLFCHAGYISHRHLLPLVAFSFAWLADGVRGMVGFFTKDPKRLRIGTAVYLTIGMAAYVPKLISPVRPDKLAYRLAGSWLRTHTQPEDLLCVHDPRIGFYAERTYLPFSPSALSRCDYLVVQRDPETLPPVPAKATPLTTGIEPIDETMAIYHLEKSSP